MTNDYILQFMAHPENRSKIPPSLLYRVDVPRRKSPGVDLYMRGLSLSEKNFDTTNLVRALLSVIQDIGEDEEYFPVFATLIPLKIEVSDFQQKSS